MHIKKNHANSSPLSTPAAGCDGTFARAHAVLFPARLALARWMYGGDTPHVHSCTHHIARATWYDQAQEQFQAWLDAGGFHAGEGAHGDGTVQDGPAAQRRGIASGSDDPTRNPAWYDITRCRVTQDSDCTDK